jgi:hypothetical protein
MLSACDQSALAWGVMKKTWVALLVITLLSAVVALARAPARSPLVGRWVLEVDKLTMPPEARPKSVTLEFGEAADGKWTTRVQIVDQADHELHSQSTLSLDGTPGTSSGTYWVDVCAATMPAPSVLVMECAWQGVPAWTRVFSVDKDSRTLRETEAYFKKDGTPVMRIAQFSRAR